MPVIFQSFENYPDDEQFSSDLDKIYGKSLNQTLSGLCRSPGTRLFCGKFNGRWIAAALITETSPGNSITISYIYVREATRKRGVGSQLMEEIIKSEYSNKNGASKAQTQLKVPLKAPLKAPLIAQIPEEDSINYDEAKAFLLALQFKPDNSLSSESKSFIYQP